MFEYDPFVNRIHMAEHVADIEHISRLQPCSPQNFTVAFFAVLSIQPK